ncbi:hypothetical protein GCM10017674_69160 [Streptomyces gardneri]|uniref:Uncharacterized protein n=2 Tax=Streptomyces gardneri TaxID=66892 RepID=A0A4Y3RKG9_9ACTN|nr:hypothetical protein SGA01_37300 [Streptomyces gardneri]GHH17815.1 hypothetical protein GCM10017674_69160 [Streptomyces gardneri]
MGAGLVPEDGNRDVHGERAMGEFLSAAFGFPSLSFSAALVAVAVFWLLVLFGAVERKGFDGDVDAERLRLGRVPVSVAASVFVVAGWAMSVTGSVLLGLSDVPRPLSALLSLALLVLAPVASWWATRRLVGPLAKLFPDEPGPSRQDAAGPAGPPERDRAAAFGQHRAAVRTPRRR